MRITRNGTMSLALIKSDKGGYRILLEGRELFCKAVIANKYLELVGATHHESGGPSEI